MTVKSYNHNDPGADVRRRFVEGMEAYERHQKLSRQAKTAPRVYESEPIYWRTALVILVIWHHEAIYNWLTGWF